MLSKIVGATVLEVHDATFGSESVRIVTTLGTLRLFHHAEDCCEQVSVEDVTGDPADLVGGVVVVCEERDNVEPPAFGDYVPESFTWTFIEIRTSKGDVTFRWLGTSNGYYGESPAYGWTPAGGTEERGW